MSLQSIELPIANSASLGWEVLGGACCAQNVFAPFAGLSLEMREAFARDEHLRQSMNGRRIAPGDYIGVDESRLRMGVGEGEAASGAATLCCISRVPVIGPMPRQEFRQRVSRQAGNAGETIGEPGLRADFLEPGADDHVVYAGSPVLASARSGE